MFDPFLDFETAGYLRNVRKDKDSSNIKSFEHTLFRAYLDEALSFLSSKRILTYQDFLEVHRILFSDYYPWAGQDRSITMPDRAVLKGDVSFCHPCDSLRAVETGLRIGSDKNLMNKKLGEVMGLFAYAHPFLDGNGRTMLLFHIELSHRAGFSIAWASTNKVDYLNALSEEINKPGQGILDAYLLKFKGQQLARNKWEKKFCQLMGWMDSIITIRLMAICLTLKWLKNTASLKSSADTHIKHKKTLDYVRSVAQLHAFVAVKVGVSQGDLKCMPANIIRTVVYTVTVCLSLNS